MRQFTKTMVLFLTLVCMSVQAQEADSFVGAQLPMGEGASAHQPRSGRPWTSAAREELAREYIRGRAQEKAAARRDRIEGMRAMGFSPQRPTVNAAPFMSHPPTWHVNSVWAYPAWNAFWYHPLNVSPNMFP